MKHWRLQVAFDKQVNGVRTEVANDHLFATVGSFRFLSCGIPDKAWVCGVFCSTCCLEQALVIDLLLSHFFFFSFSIQNDFSHDDCVSSNETSLLERTTAPHDGLPMASHRPQREGTLSELPFGEGFKGFLEH